MTDAQLMKVTELLREIAVTEIVVKKNVVVLRAPGSVHVEVLKDGGAEWWKGGLRHRDGGPAVTSPNGVEEWWVRAQLHRLDGPAATAFGFDTWWLHDRCVAQEEALAHECGDDCPGWARVSRFTDARK